MALPWREGCGYLVPGLVILGHGIISMTILKMSAEDYTISAEYLALMLEFLDRRGIGEERALEGLPIEPGCWRDPRRGSPPPCSIASRGAPWRSPVNPGWGGSWVRP